MAGKRGLGEHFGRLISENGACLLLRGPMAVVGRSPGQCDVVIADIRISRVHCLVSPERSGVFIEDVSSTNGTWVSGQRIQRVRLADRVLVHLGPIAFRFEQALTESINIQSLKAEVEEHCESFILADTTSDVRIHSD
ncbi:MAG: FHA domain-containing protein [Planctomycetaceae bacterium]|nr:FHA domain-containing protein [Planctomycetaceae bacterium]